MMGPLDLRQTLVGAGKFTAVRRRATGEGEFVGFAMVEAQSFRNCVDSMKQLDPYGNDLLVTLSQLRRQPFKNPKLQAHDAGKAKNGRPILSSDVVGRKRTLMDGSGGVYPDMQLVLWPTCATAAWSIRSSSRRPEHTIGSGVVKRLILERYDAMAGATEAGAEYETCLDPPPADPSLCHPESTRPDWARPVE